jgi:small subunit ribosomal protein S1
MVDLGGGKSTGVIEKIELLDENGQLKYKVGDVLEAYVVARRGGEVQLSNQMSQSLKSADDLERAQAQGIPLRGRVVKAVKGGFEVTVLGKTAFCPVSQIDTRFTADEGAEHLGKEYEFLVEKVEERGRNIVVSRAALLRVQAERRTKELMASLTPETVLPGTVTELRDFGAFVDIGGVEGLVHISALSHGRVAHPSEVVKQGDKVQVKVLKVERDEKGRPKISLSMKAATQDPWDRINDLVEGGKVYAGRVVNLMPFGAFVEVVSGVEGLLHISELSWTKRVHHPSEVLKIGDTVNVAVKDIDTVKKRLSLTMKQPEDDPWYAVATKFPVGEVRQGKVEKLKPFGAIVELAAGVTALLPLAVLKRKFGEAYRHATSPGKDLEVRVVNVDTEQRKILLTLADIEEEDSDRKNYEEYLVAERAAKEAAAQQNEAPVGERIGSFGALLSSKLRQSK